MRFEENQRGKKVIVKSGTVYNTLGAAKAYFDALREGTDIEGRLSDPDRSDVLDIYHRYCQLDSWDGEVKDTVDVIAVWDNRLRGPGQYAQTETSAVVSESGERSIFSIGKALAKIAV
ncbi:hypothetical protein [Pseudomonas syringae]|uniref:hypothetical protein n=1 Tax=Pseudomonas syringae TaxID=317 RepID=UPI001BD01DA4|nr:hypothetical protein [Pseudomonas syringae]MBS7437912.1 hypothetical protein [Pseudomonas syringae]MBS7461923.1 hypothetical protein [Pseudomonas syringae]